MREICKKISSVLRVIFGYGIMICLFIGGLTFFAYLVALAVGGETAKVICDFTHNTLFPIIIKASNIFVITGLIVMYLNGEMSLTMNKKKKAE